jgi:hypothetical protein
MYHLNSSSSSSSSSNSNSNSSSSSSRRTSTVINENRIDNTKKKRKEGNQDIGCE